MTLAVIGASGFLGGSIVAHGRATGVPVACIRAPRITAASEPARASARSWRRSHGDAFDALCRALQPFEVVVNAAGLARPGAAERAPLFAANAVLPAVVAQAARVAGVRRLVHVSSAAVQGRLDPLDESSRRVPISPYAVSKAEGERALLDEMSERLPLDGPPEVVVYRPTSVHGTGRAVTRDLARMVRSLPVLAVAGRGDRPVPVALIENVAAGVVFAAAMPRPPRIVLQPWEGVTTRRLLELFGARRVLSLPEGAVGVALAATARMAARSPALTARVRRVELVVGGQGVRAEALGAAGFRPPFGHDRWEQLAREQLSRVADAAAGAVQAAGPGA